jgi:3-keto-disaccharide hydrolase
MMKQIAVVLVLFTLVATGLAHAAEEKWTPLFDGKTLNGWTRRGGEAPYRVEDGAIVGTTMPGKEVGGKMVSGTPNTFLCTDKNYSNFVMELEFKVSPQMNSGVQIRSNSLKEYKDGRVHGYQVEIDPSARAWTGGIYDEGRRGWLCELEGDERAEARKAFKQNEWNHFRVEAKGDSIKTWVNGVPAADLRDSMTPTGFIALQVHGSKDPEKREVRWRKIRIQDLSGESAGSGRKAE